MPGAELTPLQMLELFIDADKTWTEQEENLLSLLLAFASSKIMERAYPFRAVKPDFPDRWLNLQVQIATELYNKMGAEGQTTHNENGINRAWGSSDVGQVLLRSIIPEVGVVGEDETAEAE